MNNVAITEPLTSFLCSLCFLRRPWHASSVNGRQHAVPVNSMQQMTAARAHPSAQWSASILFFTISWQRTSLNCMAPTKNNLRIVLESLRQDQEIQPARTHGTTIAARSTSSPYQEPAKQVLHAHRSSLSSCKQWSQSHHADQEPSSSGSPRHFLVTSSG